MEIDPNYHGKVLQLHFTVEDDGVFTTPWTATITYRPNIGPWTEVTCASLITAVWAGAFAVLVAADAAAEYLPSIPIWIDVAASVAAFLGAVGFTLWYPAVLRRRAQSARP